MKGESNNMKHDHDESDRPVSDCSSSDNGNYSELLELMVKFGKKEMKDVEGDPGELISVIDLFEKSHILKALNAIRARVVDQLKSTELRMIKHQFPNQVGTMATPSELHSTTELFLSFIRGLKSLLFKIKMIELHVLYKYPCRPELQEFVDRMYASVEDEVEQYEQELEEAGAKIKQAVEEKKEGDDDDDDATANEQRQFQSLELKVREWWNIVKGSEKDQKTAVKPHYT
ncbi:hypothetical protein ACLB2K_069789 [Fragaria x ananassa]